MIRYLRQKAGFCFRRQVIDTGGDRPFLFTLWLLCTFLVLSAPYELARCNEDDPVELRSLSLNEMPDELGSMESAELESSRDCLLHHIIAGGEHIANMIVCRRRLFREWVITYTLTNMGDFRTFNFDKDLLNVQDENVYWRNQIRLLHEFVHRGNNNSQRLVLVVKVYQSSSGWIRQIGNTLSSWSGSDQRFVRERTYPDLNLRGAYYNALWGDLPEGSIMGVAIDPVLGALAQFCGSWNDSASEVGLPRFIISIIDIERGWLFQIRRFLRCLPERTGGVSWTMVSDEWQHSMNGFRGAVIMTIRRREQTPLMLIRPVSLIRPEDIRATVFSNPADDSEAFAQEPSFESGDYVRLVRIRRNQVAIEGGLNATCPVTIGQAY